MDLAARYSPILSSARGDLRRHRDVVLAQFAQLMGGDRTTVDLRAVASRWKSLTERWGKWLLSLDKRPLKADAMPRSAWPRSVRSARGGWLTPAFLEWYELHQAAHDLDGCVEWPPTRDGTDVSARNVRRILDRLERRVADVEIRVSGQPAP